MPYQTVNGIRVYYEEHGEGDRLILINGLAFPMDLWFLQLRELSKHFRVIAFDNRGIGLSGQPNEPYTIVQMASDTAELMHALGIGKAHVAGLSMGGFIAQELALGYPEMVDRLILIATGTGGSGLTILTRAFWAKMVDELKGLKPAEIYRKDISLMAAPDFMLKHPDLLEESIAIRLRKIQPLYAFLRQQAAAGSFDSNDRVQRITQSTLVILGNMDPIFPIVLADDFVRKLPCARLIVYENCGHAILLEKAEQLNQDILEFLGR
jgi:pimeloyl-ACP methyl ester carboxylesterase